MVVLVGFGGGSSIHDSTRVDGDDFGMGRFVMWAKPNSGGLSVLRESRERSSASRIRGGGTCNVFFGIFWADCSLGKTLWDAQEPS